MREKSPPQNSVHCIFCTLFKTFMQFNLFTMYLWLLNQITNL